VTLRGALRLVVDLAVVVATIACILHYSRRREVACEWHVLRASCRLEVEDSLGRVERAEITGIRSAAWRRGTLVGLVTDAQNKDETAFFGTRDVQLDDVAGAERLRAFAVDREPDHIEILSGVRRPRVVTIAFFAGLVVYGFLTRRLRRTKLARRDA
jgi:hypothetical protein